MSEPASGIELTTGIVASYLSHHQIPATDIPALIHAVYAALTDPHATSENPKLAAASRAQIRKSVTPEAIVSFEDGRGYKMLRRHLAKYGLTPAAYRAKWGLPADYPMIAPAYRAERSEMAKARGLGRRATAPEPPATAPARPARAAKAANVAQPSAPAPRRPRSKPSAD